MRGKMMPGAVPADLSNLTSRASPHLPESVPEIPRKTLVRLAVGALGAGSVLALAVVGSTLGAFSAATGVTDLPSLRTWIHTEARPSVSSWVESASDSLKRILPDSLAQDSDPAASSPSPPTDT